MRWSYAGTSRIARGDQGRPVDADEPASAAGAERGDPGSSAAADHQRVGVPHAEPDVGDGRRLAPSEAGCPADWDPEGATTHLAFDANDDVWQGTFSDLPAGTYEYKAPLNDAWDN